MCAATYKRQQVSRCKILIQNVLKRQILTDSELHREWGFQRN